MTLDGDVRSAEVVAVSVDDEAGKRFRPNQPLRTQERAG